jgi:hypothetical protein
MVPWWLDALGLALLLLRVSVVHYKCIRMRH